jgi:hypothetical protein
MTKTRRINRGRGYRGNRWLKILLAILIVIIVGEGGYLIHSEIQRSNDADEANRLESMRRDSIAFAQKEAARLDSIRLDSIQRFMVTPDLTLFDVHGHVKSIKYNYNYDTPYFDKQPGIPTWNTRKKENYKIYTFSEKGEWSNPPGLINRQNGYITSFNNGVKNSNDSFWERYVIEWANGLISTITVSRSDDGESSYQFKYNETAYRQALLLMNTKRVATLLRQWKKLF